MLEEFG